MIIPQIVTVGIWTSGKLPFECPQIFGHSNGNFPEGQVRIYCGIMPEESKCDHADGHRNNFVSNFIIPQSIPYVRLGKYLKYCIIIKMVIWLSRCWHFLTDCDTIVPTDLHLTVYWHYTSLTLDDFTSWMSFEVVYTAIPRWLFDTFWVVFAPPRPYLLTAIGTGSLRYLPLVSGL